MNILINSINRPISVPVAAGETELTATQKSRGGWNTLDIGVAKLTKVAGEESVDEEVLRCDDALGKLVARAFDQQIELRDLDFSAL